MTAGINWDGTFKSGITHAASWGSAVRQEISKVKNSAKETRKELAAMISESVDLETDAGKKNKNDILAFANAKTPEQTIELYEKMSKSAQDYIDSCKGGEATWEGFVEYQKKMGSQIEVTGVKSKLAAVGLNIFKAAAGMLVAAIAQFAIQKLIEGFQYLINIEDELAQKADEAREQYKSINIKSIKVSENQLLFDKLIIPQSMVMSIYKNSAKYSH